MRVQGLLLVQGFRRICHTGVVSESPLVLRCKPLVNQDYNPEDPEVKATHGEMVQTMKQIFELHPLYLEQLKHVRTGDFNVRRPPPLVPRRLCPTVLCIQHQTRGCCVAAGCGLQCDGVKTFYCPGADRAALLLTCPLLL